jgi:type I restriction enzyme S subunit
MSKPTKKGLVPLLRFPEYREEPEWRSYLLKNISSAIFDGTHQTPRYTEDGIPFFSVENIVSGNKNKFISVEDHVAATTKNKPEKGDILITRIGTIGFSAVVTWNYEFSIYVTLAVVKKSDKFNSYYLHNYFQSGRYQSEILSKSLLNAVPCKINMDELRKTEIMLPGAKEQQKIADCLSSIDALITAQTQKIEALKAHKKGLMQQLFPAEGETVPKRRFPEFSGEWKLNKIGDFIESYKGGAALTPSDFSPSSDCQVIPKKAITEGGWLKIDNEKPTYCNEEFYKNNLQSVVDSSYLITTLRDLVPSGPSIGYIVKYVGNINYILAQGVYGLKPKKTFISDFLIHFSNSDIYRKMMQSVMVGSTQVHIRNSTYLGLPICVPSLEEEQQKIADCLSSIDDLITAQTQKLEALKAHKKGLMQQLFPAVDLVTE